MTSPSALHVHGIPAPSLEPPPSTAGAEGVSRARRSGERYRLAVRATNDVIWDWDARAGDGEWSDALLTVFGWQPPQARPDSGDSRGWWADRIHSDDRERVAGSFDATLADVTLDHWEADYRFARADGSWAQVIDRALILRDESGVVVRVVRAMHDASEATRATAALRESEARFRALIEAAASAVWRTDPDANLNEDLPGWRALTGMRADEILGRGWMRAFHPDDLDRARACWRKAREARAAFDVTHRLRLADGSYRWFSCRGVPVRDEGTGEIREWIGMHEDVDARERDDATARLLARGTLAVNDTSDPEQALRELADAVTLEVADACAVYAVGGDGGFDVVQLSCRDVSHADALRALVGGSGRALPISPAQVARDGRGALVTDLAAMRAGEGEAVDRALADGLGLHSCICVPIQGRESALGAIAVLGFGTLRDRPLAERELATLEELGRRAGQAIELARAFHDSARARAAAEAASAAKSDFLAALSHEIRTPLNSIVGYAQLLADGISGPISASQERQLCRIVSSAEHLRALIDEILTLSRIEAGRAEVHRAPVDLGALVDEAIDIVALAAQKKGLRLVRELPATGCIVTTDRTKLLQALVNLAGNAVKFTERGEVGFHVRQSGDLAEIEVRDTGVGIAPEHQRRIYEPFWQVEQGTAHQSVGIGLGLNVVRNLMQLLGGGIRADSRAGEGSRFTLWIPR